MSLDNQYENTQEDQRFEFEPSVEFLEMIDEVQKAVDNQPEYYRSQLDAAFEKHD